MADTYRLDALEVEADETARRLAFADGPDAVHYFIMQRDEESPDHAVPDARNIYLERDDQCWGGYGGVDRVVLKPGQLRVSVDSRMARQLGGYRTIAVGFSVTEETLESLAEVLSLIMRGYEERVSVEIAA